MIDIKVDPKETRIGWIGTGIMGRAMCSHVLNKGYEIFVFNRTKSKANDLINSGANWLDSPKEITSNSDIVFTIVGFPNDVKEVYFGEDGIFNGLSSNKVLVDMTTTEPTLAKEIYVKAKQMSCSSLDAPVSGGDIGAQNGKLSIMIGGDKEVFKKLLPVLKLMGENIVYQGEAGSGQHTKMCNQIAVAANMIGVCENLLYCYKAGLDPYTMLKSVGSGAASSWLLNNLGPKIVDKDYDPGFFVEHFIKDMAIAVKESEQMGIDLPGLKLVKSLYERASEMGHGKLGTQALILALESLSKKN